jgi:HK97 family phage portal protein
MTDRPRRWWHRFTARSTRPADDVQPGRIYVRASTQAGVSVDPETALKNAVVWACIRYLTNAVAQLPWRVMREERDGDKVLAPTHPVDWILQRRPCPEMGSFTWRQTMLGNALRYGNGYAEIERDNAGRPIALWPLHPLRVTPRRRQDTGALYYDVQGDGVGQRVELDPSEVFHLRGFGDGPVGYNVVEYAAQSIGWAQATELFGASYFGEGMHPAGFVEGAGALTKEGKANLRAELKQLFGGPRRAFRTGFLDAGMKWIKMAVQPDEAQFIETRQHQVEEICRWFGVPPHKVMHLLRATFSNIEHQSIEVVTDSVVPWVRILEDEADYKLFGQNRMNFFTALDLSALLRGDLKAQAEHFSILRNAGVYSVDEIRPRIGLNKIGEAAGGNIRLAPINHTRLEMVGQQPEPPASPSEPDQQDTPADQQQDGPGRRAANIGADAIH